MMMLVLSLIANVAITFAVSLAIWRDSAGIGEVFGSDTPARRILACLYLTIGLASCYALIQLASGQSDIAWSVAKTLFPLQIIYKLMTAIAVGLRHPVVITNLGIVVLHTITLLTLL